MKTTTYLLPGIQSIGWVECEKLQSNVALNGICGNRIPVLTEIHPVPFFGQASCECSETKESGGVVATATLKFNSDEVLPLHQHVGFVVTDNNGENWLIGSKEPPFPVIKMRICFGDCDGERAGAEYEVKHTAIKTMMRCTI